MAWSLFHQPWFGEPPEIEMLNPTEAAKRARKAEKWRREEVSVRKAMVQQCTNEEAAARWEETKRLLRERKA